MVSLVESVEAPGDIDQLQKDLSAAVTAQPAQGGGSGNSAQGATQNKAERPSWCPEKFWNAEKGEVDSVKLAESYSNLESSYGRMANDLGHQRKLTDRLLDLKRETDLQQQQPPKPPALKGDELLENPSEALDRYLAAREAQRESPAVSRVQQLEAQMAAQALISKHPDYQTVASEPEFLAWVQASPYRARLGAQVAQQQDWVAADELLTEYKDRKRSQAPAPQQTQQKPQANEQELLDQARKAGLEGSGGGSGSGKSGKVYRRADLLELKLRKPEVYYDEQFQAEILKAYAEGRVK